MPAKPGVSNVRTVAPGSANGRGGAAGAALSRSESPSVGADRLDHRMARIRTHVRSACPVSFPRVAGGAPRVRKGPRTEPVRGPDEGKLCDQWLWAASC